MRKRRDDRAKARPWLAAAVVSVGVGAGVVVCDVSGFGLRNDHGASGKVGPAGWHQRLNALAAKFNDDEFDKECGNWWYDSCAVVYEEISSELGEMGREIASYDVTGFARTIERIELVNDDRDEFGQRCTGHSPLSQSSETVEPEIAITGGQSFDDLSPDEQYEAGKAMIERASEYDSSDALRAIACMRLVGTLRTSVQDVADALQFDRRRNATS